MRGIRTPVGTVSIPAEDFVYQRGIFGVAVTDKEPDPRKVSGVFEVHEQVADGLGDPVMGRVRGGAEYAYPPADVVDDGENVLALTGQRDRLDEVHSQDRLRLISYNGGRFVVTVARPGQLAEPKCDPGWYCFWDGRDFSGNRGKLKGCGTQALAQWNRHNRIVSVYNRTGDYVTFWDYATGVYQDFPGNDDYNNVLHPRVYDAAHRWC